MGDFYGFAFSGKHDGMLADDRAASQCGESDRAAFASPGDSVADLDGVFVQIDVAAFGGGFPQQQGSAGRGINLMLVVHFQYFNVKIRRVQRLGCLSHQHRQQIDTEAHIAGFDDACMAGSGGEFGFVIGGAAGGADDMNDAGLCGQTGKLNGGLWDREIDNAIGCRESRQCVVGNGYAIMADACKLAAVLSQM